MMRAVTTFPHQSAGQLIRPLLAFLIGLFLMGGCSTSGRYLETHDIPNLRIVFLDTKSLEEVWEAKTGQSGTQFQPWLKGDLASIKTVRGFYDFSTSTLYCPKWDFEVCGHELHHAALGHFHPNQ